jgi:hypothetical protein
MQKCRFFIFIDLRLMKWYLSPQQSFFHLIFVYINYAKPVPLKGADFIGERLFHLLTFVVASVC